MYAKTKVIEDDVDAFSKALADRLDHTRWNFHKYLIDRRGNFPETTTTGSILRARNDSGDRKVIQVRTFLGAARARRLDAE